MDIIPARIQDGVKPITHESVQPSLIDTIQIPQGPKVLMVKDVLGNEPVPVVLPVLNKDANDILNEMYPRRWESREVKLEERQVTNFIYCTSVLKMPVQYAAFLAFGTNYNVDSQYFPIPDNDIKIPLTVAMRGESAKEKGGKGVGKSTLTAVLAARLTKSGLSVLVFDYEPFYDEGASLYLKALQESGWKGSYQDAVTLIDSLVWQGGTLKKPGRLKSVREIMEGDRTGQGIKFFRDTATRPDIIIFDMPGVPGVEERDLKTGKPIKTRRSPNIYDLFGLGVNVVLHTDRPVLIKSKYSKVEPIERKLAFFQEIVEEKMKGK